MSNDKWQDTSYRGDTIMWLEGGIFEYGRRNAGELAASQHRAAPPGLTNSASVPPGLANGAPLAHLELGGNGGEPQEGLAALMRVFQNFWTALNTAAPHLGLTGRTSVQVACYPGSVTNARHYVKHRDAKPLSNDSTAAELKAERRRVTCVWYCNPPHVFDAKRHGGCLRVFAPKGHRMADGSPHVDVQPLLDRMVVFRSEHIEHEVLPAFAPRMAVTCWMYARGKVQSPAAVTAGAAAGDAGTHDSSLDLAEPLPVPSMFGGTGDAFAKSATVWSDSPSAMLTIPSPLLAGTIDGD